MRPTITLRIQTSHAIYELEDATKIKNDELRKSIITGRHEDPLFGKGMVVHHGLLHKARRIIKSIALY